MSPSVLSSTTSTPRVVVMDTFTPYKHSSFSSVLLVFYLSNISSALSSLISMIMDLARYKAMDAQRFDPMRRQKKTPSHFAISSPVPDMGQVLRRLSHPETPANDVVGGIWSDHELVLVPLEVSPQRHSFGSFLAESLASLSSSGSTASASSSTTSSTYFTTPSPTAESASAPATSSSSAPSTPPPSSPRRTRHQEVVDTFDREDLIITRTIIRPVRQPSIRGMFSSRPSSPLINSRPTSPLSRPNTPTFQALNCFRPGGFGTDLDDVHGGQMERGIVAARPVLQVIVTQTREQYEQDLAFKEVVQEVYPEAVRRRRAVH